MYINLESDYAVRILVYLCRRGERTDAGTIAEATGVTQRFALKILRKLVAGGVMQSFKGIRGGYLPARGPEEISLLEVIELVEGRYYFSRCLDDTKGPDNWCAGGDCKVQHIYSEISEMVRDRLRSVTFDQLL